MAYIPGLKRKKLVIIRKTRTLPTKGEVLVKVGDVVSPDTAVAKASIPGEPYLINVADQLGTDADEIWRYMRKKIGEAVEKDESIAGFTAFFGLIKKFVKSPVKGSIETVSDITGQIIIREPPQAITISAYIPGHVEKLLANEGAIVEVPGAYIQGILGIGGETNGELMVMNTKDRALTAEMIGPECKGKILITQFSPELSALRKAVEVGAKGIISGGIDPKTLTDFLGHKIGVVITGHEELGLTLVVMEGFGEEMNMLDKTFQLLKEFDGRLACINGATQIRAGVIRPEIIIPQEDVDLSKLTDVDIEDTKVLSEGLMPGTPIRIIGEPYFGAQGLIVELPSELQATETESSMRVLIAELSDGRRVLVPRANVEIISE